MPACTPPKRNAESNGAQNIWRGGNCSDIPIPVAGPSFGAALCTAIESPPLPVPFRLLHQCTGDHEPLDLRGSFIDLGDARVAKMTFDVHLLRVAHASVDLQGLVADAVRGFAGVELRHGCLAGEAQAAILH